MSRNWIFILSFLLLGLGLVLAFHSLNRQSVTRTVGDHNFLVSKNQLESDWLGRMLLGWPAGFEFILNPDRDPREQIRIEIAPVGVMCPRGYTDGANPRAPLCSKASLISPSQSPLSPESLQKRYTDKEKSFWTYSLHEAGADQPVIACSTGGRCIAMAAYKDLICRINFLEASAPQLPTLVASAQATLSKWEAAAH